MNFTTIIFYLLIDDENHRYDVLERRRIGVEIGPKVVLQILSHLCNGTGFLPPLTSNSVL